MHKSHTRTRRWMVTSLTLLMVVVGLTFSNRFVSWASKLATGKFTQTQDSKSKIVLPAGQGDKKAEAKAGGAPKPAGDEDDADLPSFARGVIEKDEYLERRDDNIKMLRGLPYPDNKLNVRALAIRQMQQQESGRPESALDAWVPIGPAPIPNGQTTTVITPVSGRVTAIDVHPTNPDIVYVGTAQGGLYRSLNGGATWTPLMDNALSLAIGAVTISPSDPTTVFVGTGEANFSADCYFGVGVYVIKNAESTNPTLIGPLNKDGGNNDVMTGRAISRILVHPTDGNTIFVATASGTASNPNNTTGLTVPAAGFYRSTNALSANPTFTRLTVPTGAGITSRSISDATIEPGNPNVVNCVVLGTNAANDGGIWRTTNALDPNPASVTFTRTLTLGTATGTIRADLAINKVGSTVTIIAATGESSTGRMRKSTDGGATWSATIAAANGFCSTQCSYDNEPAISPTDANIIFLGGATTFIKSTNGGTSFANSGTGLHADHHAIVFAPSNPSIVYEGNDGGIYKSTDTGATWSSLNNSGFSATQFQSLAVHPRDRNFSLGGTQDNGTNFYRSDGSWIRADFGDGGYAAIDQSSYDNTSVTTYHTYFNQTNAMGFGRITNTGNAQENGWQGYGCGFGGFIANGITCTATNVLFYAPVVLGPGTPNTVYFGSDVLYRSANSGVTMTKVSQEPLVSGVAITTIAISPQNDNVRIVGLRGGQIFATTNGSTTLTNITSASFPSPARAIGRVAIDPSNSNTAYATFLGFGVTAGQHIWKTTNLSAGTVTWSPAGNGIPDVPVNALVIDPKNSSTLYAGTDIGVYQSTDGGASWIPYGTGLPRVAVFDLAIQSTNRILRAATHGRGIYEISLPGVAVPLATLEGQPVIATPIIDNGNGLFDAGEDGTITIPLKNVGQATATGITATLTTSTPGVTILTGSSAYPNIAPGATQNNVTPFVFRISPTFLCGTRINFTLTFTYNDPASPRAYTFSLPTGTPGSTGTTFTYAGAAVAIPDNNATGISVPLTVSGLTSAISSVKFTIGGSSCNTDATSTTVGLNHSFVGDLAVFLVSPAGTAVQLTPISSNSGHNFCQTVFDDSAATAFSAATAAQAPYTGSFRPVQPLSAFTGENGNGQWTVAVFDLGAGDTGSLRAFSLELKTATCAKANTLTTITSSANPSIVGQPVTLTATVAPAGAATGTVQFKDNGVNLGAPVVVAANGTASITTSALTQGIHPITAEYSGDANFNPSTGSLTQVVDKLVVSLADPAVCTGPGGVVAVTASVTNSGNAPVAVAFTATLPPQLLALPGTCTATVGTCTVVNASTVTVAATLNAGQTTVINYQTQIADGTPTGTQMCVSSAVSFAGGAPATVQACTTANCPTAGPGLPLSTTSPLNDQKAGSVLIYNVYTSATDPTRQNTRLSLTNTSPTRGVAVHLFFVDGASCSIADSYICLTANQTASFLASDLDPGTTGYVVAVATDAAGCPINFNNLIGDEYVKFSSGHAANLAAESITAIAGGLPLCNTNSTTSTLAFDGVSYNVVPRVLALDNVGSRADGNDTLLILNRIGGNLATGASTLGTVFGILYDDSESGLSFSVTGSCQLRNSLSNTFPRTTPRFENFIPAGRSGWLKVFSQSDIGISGAAINFNANAGTSAGAFNQGHNLHALTNTAAASYTIPVFPPGC